MKKFEIWQELPKCKSDQMLLKKNCANRLTLCSCHKLSNYFKKAVSMEINTKHLEKKKWSTVKWDTVVTTLNLLN